MTKLLILSFFALFLLMPARAQVAGFEKAREIYKSGDYKAAAAAMQKVVKTSPGDAEAWYFLGICQVRALKPKDAEKSLRKAVELDPAKARHREALASVLLGRGKVDDARAEAMEALRLNPRSVDANYVLGVLAARSDDYRAAYDHAKLMEALDPKSRLGFLLRGDALMLKLRALLLSPVKDLAARAAVLREASDAYATSVRLSPASGDAGYLGQLADATRTFADYFERLVDPSETAVVTKIKLLAKPRALYTDEARYADISGTVVLLVGFGADGKVNNVIPLRTLGHGLDENAIRAAFAIQFEPETVDGKPVTVARVVEYTFTMLN